MEASIAPRPVACTVQLALDFVVGAPETISFSVLGRGSVDHQTVANGVLRFVGLPAGAAITSCAGYTAIPTPAVAATWGGVKAVYR